MRHSLLPLASAAVLAMASASITPAQRHEIPQLNSCVKEFLDPEMYNYLTFKNTCAQGITLVFLPKDGSGPGGTMDLRPEAKDSVGKSEGKVPKVGTYEFFVCPLGSLPLDDSNQVVSKPGSSFRCQEKTK